MSVDPYRLVADVSLRPLDEFAVVAAGKAAWAMANALVDRYGDAVVCGIGTGPRGARGHVPAGWDWYSGEHPLPGRASERAGQQALDLAEAACEPLPLVVLLSGGASAMLSAPAPGLTIQDKAVTTDVLLRAGVAIDGLNAVRKHLSAIKGGRLAALAAGETITLAISDVHGPIEDDPSTIGSGPTVPDPTTYADAVDVITAARLDREVPEVVLAHLRRARVETPKPGDPRLAGSEFRILANRHTAMRGAMDAARARGYVTERLQPATSGEAREAGAAFARAALAFARTCPRACALIASGETTVRVRGEGRGGRNQEFALGAAETLERWAHEHGRPAIVASAGTDGIDGPTDAAGAIVDHATLARARAAGLDPARALHDNNTYDFFRTLQDLIVWGPTGTNVGDVHVALVPEITKI